MAQSYKLFALLGCRQWTHGITEFSMCIDENNKDESQKEVK